MLLGRHEKSAGPDDAEAAAFGQGARSPIVQEQKAVAVLVGSRDGGTAIEFMQDLAGRLANRVQLTTDGHKMYLPAVEDAFGGQINYAQLVKVCGAAPRV